jgi:hypothetical protein
VKNLDDFRESSLAFLLAITYETIQALSTAFNDEQREHFSSWCETIRSDTRTSVLHLRRLVEALAATDMQLCELLTPTQFAWFEKAWKETVQEVAQA